MYYVGQTMLPTAYVGPANGQGSLKLLVPGSPDCRARPVGDGLIGVEGQNCPFQMYTLSGVLLISKAGSYIFCTTSADGYALALLSGYSIAFDLIYPCLYRFSSNLYLDEVLVVNNDYAQTATQRCGTAIHLQAGNHTLYVEGWARSASLSITATFNGYDSLNSAIVIPGLWQCNPNGPRISSMNFTICGYMADYSLTLGAVTDLTTYYNEVRARIHPVVIQWVDVINFLFAESDAFCRAGWDFEH